jgi:two-component system, NtrC family, sensor histidine kinase PilS
VVLLEDARTAQARLRQEKLAAMGRVSAGIAHEIRNPLAAIAQANALMQEDQLTPAQQQLGRLVSDNVRRLQRIVDDVLELTHGAVPDDVGFDARAAVWHGVNDWARTAGVQARAAHDGSIPARVRVDLPAGAVPVWFDPEHLRRVLVNLLDNALRHGTSQPDAILLRLAVRDDSHAVLVVSSDGAAIDADVEPHLFEPFFSTRSRGSGLGLYICRELCEQHGGSIEFRARSPLERHRNSFVVTLRRAPERAPA